MVYQVLGMYWGMLSCYNNHRAIKTGKLGFVARGLLLAPMRPPWLQDIENLLMRTLVMATRLRRIVLAKLVLVRREVHHLPEGCLCGFLHSSALRRTVGYHHLRVSAVVLALRLSSMEVSADVAHLHSAPFPLMPTLLSTESFSVHLVLSGTDNCLFTCSLLFETTR